MIYLYSCACITFQLDNSTVICDKTELRFFHRGNFCSAGIAPLSATPWLLNLGQCKLIARRGKQVAERCMPSSNSQRGVYSGIEEKQLAKTQSQNPLEENDVICISFRKGNVTSPFVSENFEAFIRLCPSHLSMNSNCKTLTFKSSIFDFYTRLLLKVTKITRCFLMKVTFRKVQHDNRFVWFESSKHVAASSGTTLSEVQEAVASSEAGDALAVSTAVGHKVSKWATGWWAGGFPTSNHWKHMKTDMTLDKDQEGKFLWCQCSRRLYPEKKKTPTGMKTMWYLLD